MKDNSSETYFGEVIFFSNIKNFGFLSWEKNGIRQDDMFCHFSGIKNEGGFRTLKRNQLVSFQIGTNKEGRPIAVEIVIIK